MRRSGTLITIVQGEIADGCVLYRSWIVLAQGPHISALQQRHFEQLAGYKMPASARGSAELQAEVLRKQARGKCVLVVVDDVWESKHLDYFDCVDKSTRSKLLLTTR